MSSFFQRLRYRPRPRYSRGRVFLLVLLAGLILAWSNGALGCETVPSPRSWPAFRKSLNPVNFAGDRTIVSVLSN